jgi:hypothetical protein
VKLVHSAAWAFFAGCIVALPVVALAGRLRLAAWLAAAVLLEVGILAVNRWRGPLTGVAARYATDRQENFDIYLPLRLARYNKQIFGALDLLGLAVAAWAWLG